ncbi:MAG TPA: tetratricopeptide repeat protein, partial [Dokdonella sp.]
VSDSSRPLEKVATKNLDALRLYSLGLERVAKGQFAEAINFYDEALKIDPQFASAHLSIALVLNSAGRNAEARKEIELALAAADRLTDRDRLLGEAWLATVTSSSEAVRKWKVLSDAYPDFSAGAGGYAYFAWQLENRYDDDVFAKANVSASRQNPKRGPAVHLLGILNLGVERYADALLNFDDAEAGGVSFKPYHAATLVALRRYDDAAKLLPARPETFDRNAVLGTMNELLRVAIPLARGDWAGTSAALSAAHSIAQAPVGFDAALNVTELALFEPPSAEAAARIRTLLDDARTRWRAGDADHAASDAGIVLLYAWLDARVGAAAAAADAVAEIERGAGAVLDSAVLAALRSVAKAQIALAQDRPAEAVALLRPLLDGREPCLAHAVLLDAYTKQGDAAQAEQQARWLTAHPGRAFAEYGLDKALMPFDVAQSRLAALALAELAAKRGDLAVARREFDRFERDWRAAGAPPALLARVAALQSRVSP